MIREVLVNEPVDALVRMMPNGEVRPTSFLWRNKTRYVSDLGRQWEERVGGQSLRCFLLKTVDDETYELRWDPGANEWSIHRAWLRDVAV
jgi:hypothetical protein